MEGVVSLWTPHAGSTSRVRSQTRGMEAPSGVEPLIAALQTAPFTLGYGASVHVVVPTGFEPMFPA